jgi:hypothetical protein
MHTRDRQFFIYAALLVPFAVRNTFPKTQKQLKSALADLLRSN